MYDDLKSAYDQQHEELTQLQDLNTINQRQIKELGTTQDMNEKLKSQQKSASKQILDLQSKIDQLSNASSHDMSNDQEAYTRLV